MASFYTPLSGLNADSTALNTIANNLSNMSTTAYKSEKTNFSDLFYQQVGSEGSGDAIQVGGGVKVSSNSIDFTQGSYDTSGTTSSDVALDGNGFFVVNDGGTNLLTRDGTFTQAANGNLVTAGGLEVMGFPALKGVVNTSGALAPIALPVTGDVQQPQATTNFGMTANLDSSAAIGATVQGQVQVYDSLGNNYQATVNYTKTATNQWSYSVTLPDTLTAAPATAPAAVTGMPVATPTPTPTSVAAATTVAEPSATVPNPVNSSAPVITSTSAGLPPSAVTPNSVDNPAVTLVSDSTTTAGTTVDTYTFAPTGTVNQANTSLTITGPLSGGAAGTTSSFVVSPSHANGTVAQFMADITGAAGFGNITNGAITLTNPSANVLVISGPTATLGVTGGIQQDVAETTTNFNLFSSSATPVDPASSDPAKGLSLKVGAGPTVTATPFAKSVSLTTYAANLSAALASNNVSGVTVQATNGVLSITGPSNLTIGGTLVQDFPAATTNYTFGSYTDPATGLTTPAGVDPATKLTITGPTASGTPQTVSVSPSIITGESVTQYATDITAALSTAGILGVTVAPVANGVLSITGASASSISGYVNQDILGTTVASTVSPTSPVVTATTPPLAPAAAVPATVPTVTTTLTAAAATMPSVTGSPLPAQSGTAAGTYTYNFVAGATVNPNTDLTFTGQTAAGQTVSTSAPLFNPGETLLQYKTALAAALGAGGANLAGVNVNLNGNQLSIVGPAGPPSLVAAGSVSQDFTGTNIAYNFTLNSTINASTALTITGPTASGGTATITKPPISANETITQYAQALNNALSGPSGAGIVGVTVTADAATGQLSILGPSAMTINSGNTVKQDLAFTTTNYNFVSSSGALATVAPTTNLAITEGGQTVSAPASTSSLSVSAYALALQGALTSAGITDVTVQNNNGVLSITNPADSTIGGAVNQSFTGAQTTFDFGTYTDPNTGLTVPATVAPGTSLTISGPTTTGGSTNVTVTPSNPAGESLAQYVTEVQNQLAAKNITGVTVSASNGVLSIVGPDTVTVAGNVSQNMLGTTSNYTFQANSTVDPTTNLRISGETANGTTTTITAPAVAAGETLAEYATALTSALTAANITNVSVAATNGQLSISGANVSTTGTVVQGLADTAINYDFGPSATVSLGTNIAIVGPTVSGTPPTAITNPPQVTAGETVAEYAAALNKALTQQGINTGPDGVSVTATGGLLSIVGPAATFKTQGSASQDLTATTIAYNFGSSGGQEATVDPTTNLTISGLTTSGATATTIAPTVTAGMTLTSYATALTNALTAAGIAGTTISATAAGQLSITGAGITTSGSLIQDPVSSANASGSLVFNSNGGLVSPAANVSGISFAGLSDGAAPMDMTWNLLGSNGASTISQVVGTSSVTAPTQNGYQSGAYQGFAIGLDGTVTASYSNGQTQAVGQLALANVTNLQGLALQGNGDYATTTASGPASIGISGTDGLATIKDSALEMSNVNISAEFSDLIIAQRAFEANSKAITTFDTITQETINMIH
ncbi:MAG: flagellar hook-basal body complex protein [Terracidiphilus sp.]